MLLIKNTTSNNRKKSAFSLIELSVVILITSILISASLSISQTNLNKSKTKVTKERIEIIYKAMMDFALINKRLPCPSRLDVSKGSVLYGVEATNPGTCDDLIISTDLVYGAIPFKTLGIDINIAEDGFGTKFSYIADRRFTKKTENLTSTDGFEMQRITQAPIEATPLDPIITVQSSTGNNVMTNALFVLISHGINQYGGYNATSTLPNDTSNALDEEKSNLTNDGVDPYDSIFISQSNNPNFDDIVLFKNRIQFVKDAGWEFMTCIGIEAEEAIDTLDSPNGTEPISWTWNNALYSGMLSSSSNTCIIGSGQPDVTGNPDLDNPSSSAKMCGKYGIWNAINYSLCDTPAGGGGGGPPDTGGGGGPPDTGGGGNGGGGGRPL